MTWRFCCISEYMSQRPRFVLGELHLRTRGTAALTQPVGRGATTRIFPGLIPCSPHLQPAPPSFFLPSFLYTVFIKYLLLRRAVEDGQRRVRRARCSGPWDGPEVCSPPWIPRVSSRPSG